MEVKEKNSYRRLYRHDDDGIIAGVCAGIGDYFSVDPVILRIALLVSLFFWGGGFWLYLLAWVLIPAKPRGF